VELCRAATSAGAQVRLLYLSGEVERDDVRDLGEVRRLRLRDLLTLRGVIHTHCLRPDLLGAILATRQSCRVVTTLHNYFLIDVSFDHTPWKTRLAYWVWARCIARVHARVTLSHAMRRYYRRLLPRCNFDVAYNFRRDTGSAPQVDCETRAFVDREHEAGRVVLAFVGSISRRKNVIPLARAVARSSGLALLVCGGGPLASDLRTVCADLSSHVRWIGVTAHPAAFLSASDFLVLPSFAEGLPLVVIEALMAGRPTLMSNIAVHRELARLGAGMTFDHRTFSDLEQKAAALEAKGKESAVNASRQLYELEFSVDAGFARYRGIFQRHDPQWSRL
jgi:glycosyltransferase involved in cell wall biosynthesis